VGHPACGVALVLEFDLDSQVSAAPELGRARLPFHVFEDVQGVCPSDVLRKWVSRRRHVSAGRWPSQGCSDVLSRALCERGAAPQSRRPARGGGCGRVQARPLEERDRPGRLRPADPREVAGLQGS
jgi:hypothetical protein